MSWFWHKRLLAVLHEMLICTVCKYSTYLWDLFRLLVLFCLHLWGRSMNSVLVMFTLICLKKWWVLGIFVKTYFLYFRNFDNHKSSNVWVQNIFTQMWKHNRNWKSENFISVVSLNLLLWPWASLCGYNVLL